MTLDKARELLKVQAGFGGFYNRNSAKLILAEVSPRTRAGGCGPAHP